MSKEEILEECNKLFVTMANVHIDGTPMKCLLDLYQKEKQKNEAMQEKIQHRLEMLEREKTKAIEHEDFISVADEAQIQLCKELLEERN